MPKTNGKQAPPLSFAVTPTVARDARPSHPSPYRKKSRFAKKKSAPPKKNCAYSLPDRNVFVGRWVNCLFGSFPHPFYGGGGWVPIFRVCSDLDQNRAVLWSKSEMKHPKHLKHLKHLKHSLWMFGLLFCKHFKELGGKVKDGVEVRQYQKGMLLFLGG